MFTSIHDLQDYSAALAAQDCIAGSPIFLQAALSNDTVNSGDVHSFLLVQAHAHALTSQLPVSWGAITAASLENIASLISSHLDSARGTPTLWLSGSLCGGAPKTPTYYWCCVRHVPWRCGFCFVSVFEFGHVLGCVPAAAEPIATCPATMLTNRTNVD